jgi:2-polyprenyl-6-methoxyphenol hydroxylase-like FAD-dependent oxidoreductase
MAMQDAVVLADALERAHDLDTALATFGAARFPVCQFIQDASRAVGEAGARETADDDPVDRHSALKVTAQTAVDKFYKELHALIAEGDARLTAMP